MVTCAGMVGEAAASDETSSAPLLAGANSPPIPPGLLAGQRGCLIGSQSAFSMPPRRSFDARFRVSRAERTDLVKGEGSSILIHSALKLASKSRPESKAEVGHGGSLSIAESRVAAFGARKHSPVLEAVTVANHLLLDGDDGIAEQAIGRAKHDWQLA